MRVEVPTTAWLASPGRTRPLHPIERNWPHASVRRSLSWFAPATRCLARRRLAAEAFVSTSSRTQVEFLHGFLLNDRPTLCRAQSHRLAARWVARTSVQRAKRLQDLVDRHGSLQAVRRSAWSIARWRRTGPARRRSISRSFA